VHPPTADAARRPIVFPLALALAALAACGDDAPAPTGPGDTPSTVDVAFCDGLTPEWVAFQDGDGEWTRAQPAVAGPITTFRHTFATNRGAIATVHHFASEISTLTIQFGTPAELAIVGDTNPDHCGAAEPRTLLGTVAGLAANEAAFISAGRSLRREVAYVAEGSAFVLGGLTAGAQDLLAARATLVDDEVTLTGMILRRRLDLPDSATIAVLDFDSGEAFQPVVHTVTLLGLGQEGALAHSRFRTANSEHLLPFVASPVVATSHRYSAVPEARLEPGDLHSFSATTAPSNDPVRRSATVHFRTPADRTLAFGAVPDEPQLSVVSGAPTLRPRARFGPQLDYDRITGIAFQQGEATLVAVSMTAAYAGLAGSGYDLIVPELTGVEGFDPRWALQPGTSLLWTSSRIGGTLGLGLNAVPFDGATQRAATSSGELAP
jgi:hypothetical protein